MDVDWKRNLAVVFAAQFLSIMGFQFALPFAPYFMQKELGITDPLKLKIYVSLFAASAPVTLALFSPLWGILADRYGRRLMLLRANFGGMVVLFAMAFTPSVEVLLLLRLLQGVFTGTMTAAQTLVSAHTPPDQCGFALGVVSAAVFSGGMVGGFLGGLFADLFGYRAAFFCSSLLLLCGALLVLLGTREKFVRDPGWRAHNGGGATRMTWAAVLSCWPVLTLIAAMAFVRQFDAPMLPLLVQDVHGQVEGAAMRSGSLSAVAGVAGLLAGVILGRLADRLSPPRIARWSAIGAGVLMSPQVIATGMATLFASRFCTVFCAGGLDPVFQVWLAKTTPPSRRGTVFGLAATAKSVGWSVAPLVSGVVASTFGVRSVFLTGALLYLALVPAIGLLLRHRPVPTAPDAAGGPEAGSPPGAATR
jgi:DHA1 family multidrug resistance protein-like MFS transporter